MGAVPPIAGFVADVTSGPAPLSVRFYDQSSGATEWLYYFGDGIYSKTYESYVDYIYQFPGIYTVQQIVSNAAGSDTLVRTDYITVYEEVITPEDAAQAVDVWNIYQNAALRSIARRRARLAAMKGTITDKTEGK